MRIDAFCNNKGGVTKTTTTINLGYGLARAGRRVLIVDADAQSNSTYSLLGQLPQDKETIHKRVLASQSPWAQKLAGLLTGENISLQNIYRYALLRTSTRL